MERLPRDDFYKELVYLAAKRSSCPRAQVGCILVRDGGILAVSYNGAPAGTPHCMDEGCLMEDGHCVRATHAEVNLIAYCAREGIRTLGATAYITHKPCPACAKALIRAGIELVSYYEDYGSDEGLSILYTAGVAVFKPLPK